MTTVVKLCHFLDIYEPFKYVYHYACSAEEILPEIPMVSGSWTKDGVNVCIKTYAR